MIRTDRGSSQPSLATPLSPPHVRPDHTKARKPGHRQEEERRPLSSVRALARGWMATSQAQTAAGATAGSGAVATPPISSSCITYRRRVAPKTIRHYLIGEPLGEGSFAKVRDGYDFVEHRHVAIKVFDKKRLKRVHGADAIVQREISTLEYLNKAGAIESTNVVSLRDHWADVAKEKMYIVFECVGGGTLRSLADLSPDKKLPLPQAKYLFSQLLSGLSWLHSHGVFHRDIKPDNLMISCGGDLLINDFGASLVVEPVPAPGVDVECDGSGAPAFQPPEVAKTGRSRSAAKIDVWGAGMSLFIITQGRYPFGEHSNVFQLFKVIAETKVEIPDTTPALLADLLKKMLDPSPSTRISVADASAHLWLKGAATEPKEKFIKVKPKETAFTKENLDKWLHDEEGDKFEYMKGEELREYGQRRWMCCSLL